jgi:F-type H+-transporting ATPase subunit b
MIVSVPLAAQEGYIGGPPWGELFFSTINFLLFIYLLQRFLKEPVRRFLAERQERIVKSLQDASTNLEQSESLLREVQLRLDGVEQEIADLKTLSDQQMEHERIRLITRAEKVAARIRRDGALVAEQEVSVAKQKLRVEFAEMAVEGARFLLPERLTLEIRRRISEDFTVQLEVGK